MIRCLFAAATLTGYVATIPAANWAITHYGMVPVWPGLAAPAGVYVVGIAFVLRDAAREAAGRAAVLAAMAVGVALSYLLADPALAFASAAAFALSETLDFAVYEPLRRRGLYAILLDTAERLGWERLHHALLKRAPRPQDEYIASALAASNTVGLIADSLLFLWLAFHSFQHLPGQVVGKAWMTALALAVIAAWRRRTAVRTA